MRPEIKNYSSFQNDRTTMRMRKWSTELIHENGTTLSFDHFNTGTLGRPAVQGRTTYEYWYNILRNSSVPSIMNNQYRGVMGFLLSIFII